MPFITSILRRRIFGRRSAGEIHDLLMNSKTGWYLNQFD